MAQQIICDHCMSNVDLGAQSCPYCGKRFVNTNPAGALPAHSLLAGRYTIGRCLGLDGEGITYSAIDGKEMRRVTIKEYVPVSICAARAADGRVLPRAGREVLFKTTRMDFADLYRSLVRLGRTEGLVTVLDVVETNDTAYAVREPDEGAPLSRYLAGREEPLTQEEALVLLRPVVYGVDAMHRMGLLHRGISPDTIWITPQGAKLSGFATQGLRTAGGEIKCQLADGYAAPEQYSVAEFDGKYTDVYSLAAVFYRVMTGIEPLGANLRRMDDNMPSARTANRELPGFVSAALARAMRLVPAERIQSASELLAALTAPSREVTGSKWDQLREKLGMTDRQLKILGIAAAAALLVIIISVIAILNLNRPKKPQSSSSSSVSSAPASVSSSAEVKDYTLPSFTGKQVQDVTGNTEYLKYCMFSTEYEFSDKYDEGEIISQTPSAGTKIGANTVVKLVVSKGAETATIPEDIGGMSLGDIKAKLYSLGIAEHKVQVVTQENDGTYAENQFIKMDPVPGTAVKIGDNGDTVTIYVAGKPPAQVKMPAVVGKARAEVESTLTSAGIKYHITEVANTTSYASGTVIESSVAEGTTIRAGVDTVELKVVVGDPPGPTDDGGAGAGGQNSGS